MKDSQAMQAKNKVQQYVTMNSIKGKKYKYNRLKISLDLSMIALISHKPQHLAIL
jgi:hypothetical protein